MHPLHSPSGSPKDLNSSEQRPEDFAQSHPVDGFDLNQTVYTVGGDTALARNTRTTPIVILQSQTSWKQVASFLHVPSEVGGSSGDQENYGWLGLAYICTM